MVLYWMPWTMQRSWSQADASVCWQLYTEVGRQPSKGLAHMSTFAELVRVLRRYHSGTHLQRALPMVQQTQKPVTELAPAARGSSVMVASCRNLWLGCRGKVVFNGIEHQENISPDLNGICSIELSNRDRVGIGGFQR